MDYSHTQKQANARQPTNQERRHRSVEIGDSDRDGDPKPTSPPASAPPRSSGGSHCSLVIAPTATTIPRTPPRAAPVNNPDFPAAWPRMEPITAPAPAAAQEIGRASCR